MFQTRFYKTNRFLEKIICKLHKNSCNPASKFGCKISKRKKSKRIFSLPFLFLDVDWIFVDLTDKSSIAVCKRTPPLWDVEKSRISNSRSHSDRLLVLSEFFKRFIFNSPLWWNYFVFEKKKFFSRRPLKPSSTPFRFKILHCIRVIWNHSNYKSLSMSGNILSFSTTVRYSFAISLRQRSFKAPTTVVMKIGKYCGPLGMRHFLGAEIFRHHHSLSPS